MDAFIKIPNMVHTAQSSAATIGNKQSQNRNIISIVQRAFLATELNTLNFL